MAKRFTREEVNARLQNQVKANRAILMFGAGIGLTAKCAELGGADLIGVYSTAISRMKGLPSLLSWLPYGDVNEELLEVSEEILPLVNNTPLIAGVGAHNPSLNIGNFLDKLVSMGFSGVTNEPFAGMYGDFFLKQLEKSGIGFLKEVELIETASKKDIFSVAWCMSKQQAKLMVGAGADVIGAMIGVTSGGLSGKSEDQTIEKALEILNDIIEGALEINPDVLILTHGGPLNDVKSARYSVLNTKAHGYAAGSSGERIPAEQAVIQITKEYKNINITG